MQTSVIRGTYLALEHMSREHGKDGGIIINVSSMAGRSMHFHPKARATFEVCVSHALCDVKSLKGGFVRANTLQQVQL